MNKKIRGAEKGIKFRSRLEEKIYNELKSQKISFAYEPETITLVEGFYPEVPFYLDSMLRKTKVRSITYTPDFKATINGYTVYIEAKGFANDIYPLKRKLFLKYLNGKKHHIFAEVHNVRGLKSTIIKINQLNESV